MKLLEILQEDNKELNSLISFSTGLKPANTLQLFIPRNKTTKLKSKAVPRKGGNKPNDSVLWTSSVIKNGGWTSEWAEWCKSEMPEWLSDEGFIYQVSSNIVSLQLNNDKDVVDVWNVFCEQKDKLDYRSYNQNVKNYFKILEEFPWDKIAKYFDCVYCKGKPLLNNHFMYGWDCESTVFFNLNKIKLFKNIKIDL